MIIDDEEYMIKIGKKNFHCALDITIHHIGGKWKCVVLWYLRKEKKRFGELKKLIPDITEKMLSLQLKALEKEGFVKRKIYAEIPPRVEYEMTDEGRSLIPVLESIAMWGRERANSMGKMVKVEKVE